MADAPWQPTPARQRRQHGPATLLLPPGDPPRGLVLCAYVHGNNFACGKAELLQGRPALQPPADGDVLPPLGWAVLAIDHWCFGERAGPSRSERALVKQLLWQGRSLWGYRVADTLASLDWALARPELADLPAVCLGLSMGCTMALWAAALAPRIDACLGLCCLAEFDALLASGRYDLHGEYFFVPGLLAEFSAAEIAALIAPRLHLSLVGRDDPLTPPDGVTSIDAALRASYAALGAPQRWQQQVFDAGHQETPAMRQAVLDALAQVLTLGHVKP